MTIPTPFWDKEAVGGFDDAAAKYTVVVAQLVKAQSYAWIPEDQDIGTWYKFQILETLSQKPLPQCDSCSPFADAPAEMQPLNTEEMAVPKEGGTLVINGVTIHTVDGDFPDFVVSQRYLLFLFLDSSKRVGLVRSGGVAVFTIDGSGNLAPLRPNSLQLTTDIANRFGNSLNQVRAYFNPPRLHRHRLVTQRGLNKDGAIVIMETGTLVPVLATTPVPLPVRRGFANSRVDIHST